MGFLFPQKFFVKLAFILARKTYVSANMVPIPPLGCRVFEFRPVSNPSLYPPHPSAEHENAQ